MLPFRKSLVFRIFVISFILLALPLLVDTFVIVQSRYQESVLKSKNYLIKAPISRMFILSRVLQTKKQAMNFADYFLKLKENFPDKPSPEFNEKLKSITRAGDFEDTILLKLQPDGTAKVIGSSFENDEKNKGFHSFTFYENIIATQSLTKHFTLLYISPQNENILLFGHYIYTPDEKTLLGVLIFTMNITSRLDEMLAPSHGDLELHFGLLLNNMVIIAAPESSLVFSYFFPLSAEKLIQVKKEHLPPEFSLKERPLTLSYDMGAPFIEFMWNGKKQVGLITQVQETDFFLLTYTPEELLSVNPFLNFFSIYAVFGLILLIGGGGAYLLSKRIARPFKKLSEVMEGIQKGEITARYVQDPLGFEINSLGIAFNEMVDTLLEKKYLAEEEKVKVEIYDKELRIGQQIQRGLFPTQIPTYHGIEITEKYIPAKEVGGDFYDVFVRQMKGKEQMTLVIADASGKGVHACFYSLGVRSNLRVFAREYEDVGTIMQYVNRLFYQDTGDTGMFVTVLLGIYDPETKELSFCSCGHNPPILRKANGEIEVLGGVSMALGVKKEIEPQGKKVKLQKGDLVVFYTDGISEAHDENNALFTEERLQEFIREKGDQKVEETGQELIMEVRKFQGKAPQHDDITLVLMKLL